MNQVQKWFDATKLFDNVSFRLEHYPFSLVVDSSNISSTQWRDYANEIHDRVEKHNPAAVVVIHGTDTMAYTAGALSFVLRIGRPTIITGSQIPLGDHNSDATGNLFGACLCAYELSSRLPHIDSTFLFFNHELLRANRVRKCHANFMSAFEPVNTLPIAIVQGEKITYDEVYIRSMKRNSKQTRNPHPLSDKIALFRIFPGI